MKQFSTPPLRVVLVHENKVALLATGAVAYLAFFCVFAVPLNNTHTRTGKRKEKKSERCPSTRREEADPVIASVKRTGLICFLAGDHRQFSAIPHVPLLCS